MAIIHVQQRIIPQRVLSSVLCDHRGYLMALVSPEITFVDIWLLPHQPLHGILPRRHAMGSSMLTCFQRHHIVNAKVIELVAHFQVKISRMRFDNHNTINILWEDRQQRTHTGQSNSFTRQHNEMASLSSMAIFGVHTTAVVSRGNEVYCQNYGYKC